jgi:hypothetical protein
LWRRDGKGKNEEIKIQIPNKFQYSKGNPKLPGDWNAGDPTAP